MKSPIFRIYTESRDNLPGLVRAHFDAATLTPGTGIWRGVTEESTVIEIIGPPVPGSDPRTPGLSIAEENAAYAAGVALGRRVAALASDIARTNRQASVLVTRDYLDVQEFTGDGRGVAPYGEGNGTANAPDVGSEVAAIAA